MRLGFTIVFNGEKHLTHNNFIGKMADALDLWVIVEGIALPGGSTNWCGNIDKIPKNEKTWLSADKTTKLLDKALATYDNIEVIRPEKQCWDSKDDMVNAACGILRAYYCGRQTFLWEVDVDEQWNKPDMAAAEAELIKNKAKTGCFYSNYFVGKNIVSDGLWGEGRSDRQPLLNAYRRLWLWKGERFSAHEPPTLCTGNAPEVLLSQRFNHYAYYFDADVKFKELYYKYDGLYDKWLALQSAQTFPQPLTALLARGWGSDKTTFIRHKPTGFG
jgi:hypothetical protein